MKIVPTVSAAALTALLAGCGVVESVHPLYTEVEIATPVIDPRLEGDWSVLDSDGAQADHEISDSLTIAESRKTDADRGWYDLEMPLADGETESYRFRLVRLGNGFYFDAIPVPTTPSAPGTVPAHIVGRVWIDHDLVRFAMLDRCWVIHALPNDHRVDGAFGDVTISASTGELRDLLLRNADDPEAFSDAFYLCRPGADCALRAVEDMLARAPDDDETLEMAVECFQKRGDEARAVALRQRIGK